MARTLQEIEAQIIAEKDTRPELAGLTSTSATAIWRLWVYIIAFAIWTQEVLFDKYQAEMRDMIDDLRPGTLRWYQQKCLEYQFGDVLQYINGQYVYDPIDEN